MGKGSGSATDCSGHCSGCIGGPGKPGKRQASKPARQAARLSRASPRRRSRCRGSLRGLEALGEK
eukprot:1421292-Alexandrium_andersonii.AAC.1